MSKSCLFVLLSCLVVLFNNFVIIEVLFTNFSKNCQNGQEGLSKLWKSLLGIFNIVVDNCQNCYLGLSKLKTEMIKIFIQKCQNCHLGLSKLLSGVVKIDLSDCKIVVQDSQKYHMDFKNCCWRLSKSSLGIVKIFAH